MAYDDILEEAAIPKISANGDKPLFKRRSRASTGNKRHTFGNTRELISNGTSGVNSVVSTIVDRNLNKPAQNRTIGSRPDHSQKQEKEVFGKNNKALNHDAERENKRKNLTKLEKAHEARLELTRRRVVARVARYGIGTTSTARLIAQSKAAAERRAEKLHREKRKAAKGKLAPPIVFKNDNFADLDYGKRNYIGTTKIDTDLRKSNLKTLEGLPTDKPYFDDATSYMSVSKETLLVQVQEAAGKNLGRDFPYLRRSSS